MYHRHFGLREEPFGVTPDSRFFYYTAQHREAAATLLYAIWQRRGLSLLLGRAGLGKTSVLYNLVQSLKDRAQTAYLGHPYFDRGTVLEAILASLGLESTGTPAQSHRLFWNYLTAIHNTGKTCVVVFDEAQDLNRDTLEAIRMLSNFETPTEKLVQIVLAGQPRLGETLQRPDCEQIRQRVNVVARVQPLSHPEVHRYMEHRLQTAGASNALFTSEAIDDIAEASQGVPRNVNTICFNSLSLACAENNHRVGAREVTEVLQDLDLSLQPASSKRPALVASL